MCTNTQNGANGYCAETNESYAKQIEAGVSSPSEYVETCESETKGTLTDAVARALAEEFEYLTYEPREIFLSDQKHTVWVETRLRDRS